MTTSRVTTSLKEPSPTNQFCRYSWYSPILIWKWTTLLSFRTHHHHHHLFLNVAQTFLAQRDYDQTATPTPIFRKRPMQLQWASRSRKNRNPRRPSNPATCSSTAHSWTSMSSKPFSVSPPPNPRPSVHRRLHHEKVGHISRASPWWRDRPRHGVESRRGGAFQAAAWLRDRCVYLVLCRCHARGWWGVVAVPRFLLGWRAR